MNSSSVPSRDPLPLGRTHLPGLDGLRGVAILVVLLHHFTPAADGGTALTRGLLTVIHTGWIGVDLFFVLSGFLITGILLDTRDRPGYFRNFYARRTLRIAPIYYGTLAVIFGLLPLLAWLGVRSDTAAWLFGKVGPEIRDLADQQHWLWLYLTNVRIATEGARWGVVNHFWSLAVEEHFYLVWPIVVYFVSQRALGWVCLGCIGFALGLRVVLIAAGVDPLVCYVLTPCRIDSLAFGALLAVLLRSEVASQLPRLAIQVALGSSILLAVIAGGYGRFDRDDPLTSMVGYTLLAALFAAITLAAANACCGSSPARVLCSAPLRSLGKYSYGIYVLHHFLQTPIKKLFPHRMLTEWTGSYLWAIVLHAAIAIAISFVVAWIVYHAFEKHFLRLKSRFESGPAPAPAAPAPAPAPATASPLAVAA